MARALEEKHRLVSEYYQIPFDLASEAVAEATGDEQQQQRDAREVLLAALVQVKRLSDLVNESLTLNEEDAVAVAAVPSSRLSTSSPPATPPAPSSAASPPPLPPVAVGATSLSPGPTPPEVGIVGQEQEVPSLSTLASEAIDTELPSVKLLMRLQPPTHKLIAITKSMNHHLTSLLEIIQERDEERDRLHKELQRTRDLLSQTTSSTVRLSVTSPSSRPASFISVEESSASERNQESEDDVASVYVPRIYL